MVRAYTSSAGSKEARESLAEASKGHKEYTEVSGQEVGGKWNHHLSQMEGEMLLPSSLSVQLKP